MTKEMKKETQGNGQGLAASKRLWELFVSSIGESGSNELKFYNVGDHSEVKRLELSQEGCSYLSAHSDKHLSIVMVSNNGSIYLWSVRPSKII